MTEPLISSLLPESDARKSLIERYQDSPAKALEAYIALESLFSKTVRVPGDGASKEEVAKFRKHIGVPEKAEDYAVPEGNAALAALRSIAHENSIPKRAFDALAAAVVKAEGERRSAAKKGYQDALAAELGEGAPDAVAGVKKFLEEKLPGFGRALEEAGLSEHPEIVKAMGRVAKIVSEDKVSGGIGGGGDQKPKDPKTLGARGRELIAKNSMGDRSNPKRAEEYAEFMSIVAQLNDAGYTGPDDERLLPRDPFGNIIR